MLAVLPAHATLITFSEFPYTPTPGEEGTWYGDPVGEDYAALGVHISGAWRGGFTVGGPGDSLVGGSGRPGRGGSGEATHSPNNLKRLHR